ncbi:MAG: filamentous hemagglutinin N-terminal domain-containing protein, partial [Pikeienuella sp.]
MSERSRTGRELAFGLTGLVGIGGLVAGTPLDLALAGPRGGQVTHGSAAIARQGAETVIRQSSNRAAISWESFDIGAGEGVRFQQPSTSAIALNTISNNRPTEIQGRLTANGQVWIQNPQGVMFGRDATVDVGGLLATTARIDTDDFAEGRDRFEGAEGGSAVVNRGSLTSGEGGVVLVAPVVENEGTILSEGGVDLAAATGFAVDFEGDGLLQVVVDTDKAQELQIVNEGEITASAVQLTSGQAEGVRESLVNLGGIVEATGIGAGAGEIVILGGDQARVSGEMVARRGETGGEVSINARRIGLGAGSRIDVSAPAGGGRVEIGPRSAPIPPERIAMAQGAAIVADSTADGTAGRIDFWSTEATYAAGEVSAAARGSGDGGFIDVSSAGYLGFVGNADLSSVDGQAGLLLFDPATITIAPAGTDNAQLTIYNNVIGANDLSGSNIVISQAAIAAAEGDVALEATGNITVGGETLSVNGKRVTLRSTTGNVNINYYVSVTDGVLDVEAPNGSVSFAATTGASVSAATVPSGLELDGTAITLNAESSFFGGGTAGAFFNFNADETVDATGPVTINAEIYVNGSVTINGTVVDLVSSGSYTVNATDLDITPTTSLSVGSGVLTVTDEFTLNTGSVTLVTGNSVTGGNVGVGLIEGIAGTVTIDSSGDINLDSDFNKTAGNLVLDAANDVNFSVPGAGNFTVGGDLTVVAGNNARLSETVTVGGNLDVSAVTADLAAYAYVDGDLTATASYANVDRPTTVGGNLTLNADEIDVGRFGFLYVTGNIVAQNASSVRFDGEYLYAQNVTITSSDTAEFSPGAGGQSEGVEVYTDVTITAAGEASIYAAGILIGRDLTIDAGSTVITNKNVVTEGTTTYRGALNIGRDLTISPYTAGANAPIRIAGSGDLDVSGETESLLSLSVGRNVALDAGTANVTVNADLQGAYGVTGTTTLTGATVVIDNSVENYSYVTNEYTTARDVVEFGSGLVINADEVRILAATTVASGNTDINASTGAIEIGIPDGNPVALIQGGLTQTTGDIDLDATGGIVLLGDVQALDGNVTAEADGSMLVESSATVGGTATTLTAGLGFVQGSVVGGSSSYTITSDGGPVSISGSEVRLYGSINATNGDITITALGAGGAGDGQVFLGAQPSGIVPGVGDIVNPAAAQPAGTLTASGTGQIQIEGGDVDIETDLTTSATLQIDGDAVTVTNAAALQSGNFTVPGAQSFELQGAATVYATGNVDVTVSDTATIAAGTVLDADGDLSITATGANSTITVDAPLAAGLDLTLTGVQSATGTLVTGGGQLEAGDDVLATGDLSIISGAIALTGNLITDADLTLSSFEDQLITAPITSSGAISLASTGGNLTTTATADLNAGTDITLAALGDATIGSTVIVAGGAVEIDGGVVDLNGGTMNAASLDVASATGTVNVALDAVDVGGATTVTGQTAATLDVDGTTDAIIGGGLTLTANGGAATLTADTDLQVATTIDIDGTTDVLLDGSAPISAGGDITVDIDGDLGNSQVDILTNVTSTNGAILVNAGSGAAGGPVTVGAVDVIGEQVVLRSGGVLTIQSGGAIQANDQSPIVMDSDTPLQIAATDFVLDGSFMGDALLAEFEAAGSLGGVGGAISESEFQSLALGVEQIEIRTNGTLSVFDLDPGAEFALEELALIADGEIDVSGEVLGRDAGNTASFALTLGARTGQFVTTGLEVGPGGRLGATANAERPFDGLTFEIAGDVNIAPGETDGSTILASEGLTVIDIAGDFIQENTNGAAPSPLIGGEGGAGASLDQLRIDDVETLAIFGTVNNSSGEDAAAEVTFGPGFTPDETQQVNDCPVGGVSCGFAPVLEDPVILTDEDMASAPLDISTVVEDEDGDVVFITEINGVPIAVGGSVPGPEGGTFVLRSDGTLVFVPGDDFQTLPLGQDATFTVPITVTDAGGDMAMGTLTVIIAGRNDVPTAMAGALETDEDMASGSISADELGMDIDMDMLG